MPPPARPIWTGQIRLALVALPVKLYSALDAREKISFNQIHEPSKQRIRYEKVAPGVGAVDKDEIVKGYEYQKGRYVLFSDEEFEALKIESKKTLDMIQFAPAATILKCYAPALFLVFIDILLGNTLYAAGAAVSFALVLAVKVLVSAGLSILLVPILQARTGNGGIAIVLSFAMSELVVLSGALVLLPRGTLTGAAADTARALGAAGLTLLLFWSLPSLNPWLGVPLCIAMFSGASYLLGLMRQRDVEALQSLIFRTPRPAPVPPFETMG